MAFDHSMAPAYNKAEMKLKFSARIGLCLVVWGLSFGHVGRGIDIHGSLQQTYLKSIKNHFPFVGTTEGSSEFTEGMLNATQQIDQSLRVGAQWFARNFGEEGQHVGSSSVSLPSPGTVPADRQNRS